MQNVMLAILAALGILYVIFTEVIDWAARYDYMRDNFPRLIQWAEQKRWRPIVLLLVIVLQFRVLYDLERETFANPSAKDWDAGVNSLIDLDGKTFRNQAIEIDGKRFERCIFENVTFIFRGKKTFAITSSQFNGQNLWKLPSGAMYSSAGMLASILQDYCKGKEASWDLTHFPLRLVPLTEEEK